MADGATRPPAPSTTPGTADVTDTAPSELPPLVALLAGRHGAASEKCLDRVAACLGSPGHTGPLLSSHRELHASSLPVLRVLTEWGAEGPRGARAVLSALSRCSSPRWVARIDVSSKVRKLELGVDKYEEIDKVARVVTDALLGLVSESGIFSGLSCIHLGYCKQVSDAGLSSVARGCPQLSSLNLWGCKQVTDAGVSSVAQGCPQLSSLNLEGCKQVTDAGVSSVARGCPQLSFLNLCECWRVTDAGLSSVCLLYTSPSPRDLSTSRMPSSA